MNFAHLHLAINHIPVIGTAFGLALLAAAGLRRSDELLKAGFAILIFTALSALAVFLTGEPAEHFIESFAGVAEAAIEAHEEAALLSLVAAGISGAIGSAGFWFLWRAQAVPKWLLSLALISALLTLGLMGWTANLGGQIRHEEARGGPR